MTNEEEDARNMLDKRFPSGTRVKSISRRGSRMRRGSTIWIDGDCFSEADDLIAQFKAGKLTESDAENAIRELAYGCAAKK
jgi:hypothetical protein